MDDDWTFVFGSGHTYADTLGQKRKTEAAISKPTKETKSRKQKTDRRPRKRKAFRSRGQLFYEDEPDFTSHYDATNYDLAGRDISNTFFDLRSASKARHRQKARLEKYWSFRAVNLGQLGQTHYTLREPGDSRPAFDFDCPLPEAPTMKMTKQTLYHEAQSYPRPPKNHHRDGDKTRYILSARLARRIKDKKHTRTDQQDYPLNERDSVYQYYTTGNPSLFWGDWSVEYEREHFREESPQFLRFWDDWEGGWGGVGEDDEWRWMWCRQCGELEVKMKGCVVWEEMALAAFVAPNVSRCARADVEPVAGEQACGVVCSTVDTDVTCEMEGLMEMFLRAKYDDVEESDEGSDWEVV